jgi:rubrerythrin
MTLATEGDDERRMFALIGADEALHASWLAPWIEAAAPPEDPFNRFIAGIAAAGNPQPLAFLLQVVLEGFGIAHYGTLAAHCRDRGLAATFARLAQDEALHHAGGLAAFRADRLTEADRRFLIEAAFTFLQMIRCGPQAVVAAVDHALGLRDQRDAAGVFAALDAEAQSADRLVRLRRLMAQPGMTWLDDALAAGGAFIPCTPVDCAQIYAGIR